MKCIENSTEEELVSTLEVDNCTLQTTEILGNGQFGVVYVAHKTTNPSDVFALKVISKKKTRPERVRQEYEIQSALNENDSDGYILKVFGCSETAENMFIFMDYIPTGDLLQNCICKRVDVETAFHYFEQLINGLEYIHGSGYIHRDIKPANLLVTSSRTLKIADFGLASKFRFGNEERFLTELRGTPAYLPPQFYIHYELKGPPLDVWAAGLVLMNMVTGTTQHWKVAAYDDLQYQKWCQNTEDVSNAWNGVEDVIMDLLRTILNPDKESTIEDIKSNAWYIQMSGKTDG